MALLPGRIPLTYSTRKTIDNSIHLTESGSNLQKTELMKRALTLIGLLVMAVIPKIQAGVLWTQDFSAGGDFNSYVGSGANQFNEASGYGNMVTTGFNMTLNTASYSHAGVNGLPFDSQAGYLQFSYNPVAPTAAAVNTLFYIGGTYSPTSNPTNQVTTPYTTLGMYVTNTTTGTWTIRDTAHGIAADPAFSFTGSQTITIVLNNTGGSYDYDLGGGISGTLANDIYRIYVGSVLVSFSSNANLTAVNPNAVLTGFSFTAQNQLGSVVLDNFVFATTPVPEPSTYVLLMVGLAFAISMVRCQPREILSL